MMSHLMAKEADHLAHFQMRHHRHFEMDWTPQHLPPVLFRPVLFRGQDLQALWPSSLRFRHIAHHGGQYAETAKTMAKAPADLAPETAPAETAPAEGAAASNPFQNADDAASENAQDDQPPSPSDETSS